MEEQPGQALLWRGGLYDLLQRHPRLQLLPPQDDLQDVQEEVPRGVPGTWYGQSRKLCSVDVVVNAFIVIIIKGVHSNP